MNLEVTLIGPLLLNHAKFYLDDAIIHTVPGLL